MRSTCSEQELNCVNINEELGLGRTRTEMTITTGADYIPSLEEEAILEELGLGKIRSEETSKLKLVEELNEELNKV
jgi:hypothetical protein